MTVEVKVEPTRNEHSVIFSLNKSLIQPGTGESYPDAASTANSPLARALFQIRGVQSVWILGNDVQITKDESVRWGRINSKIIETIKQIESDN